MSANNDPLFNLLRERYGHQWSIRRTARLWIATAQDPEAGHAPTLIEPDIEEFVRQLEHPPARAGQSLLTRFGDAPTSVDVDP